MVVVGTGSSSWPVEPAHRVGAFLLGMGVNEALAVVQKMGSLDQAEFSFDEHRLFDVDLSLRLPSMGLQLCFDGLLQDLRVIVVQLQCSEGPGGDCGAETAGGGGGGDGRTGENTRGASRGHGQRGGRVSGVAAKGGEDARAAVAPDLPPPSLPPLAYSGRVFAGAKKPALCLRDVCTMFGPTWIGEFHTGEDDAAYFLRYPGLTFEFPLPADWVEELAARGEHPMEIPGHRPPTAVRMWVFAKDAPSYLDALSARPDEAEAVVVRPSTGVELRGRALLFGAMPQDVFSDFGPPEQVCVKDVDAVRIHSDGSLPPRVTGPDYYYNYFHLGLDVLFDGRTHLVKKVILHTNPPTHELFSRYTRCFFEIPIGQAAVEACVKRARGAASGQGGDAADGGGGGGDEGGGGGSIYAGAEADPCGAGVSTSAAPAALAEVPPGPPPRSPRPQSSREQVALASAAATVTTVGGTHSSANAAALVTAGSAVATTDESPAPSAAVAGTAAADAAEDRTAAAGGGSLLVLPQAAVDQDGADELILPVAAAADPSSEGAAADEVRLDKADAADEDGWEEPRVGKRVTKRERKAARQKRKKDSRGGGSGGDASPLSATLSSSPSPGLSLLSASPESSPVLATLGDEGLKIAAVAAAAAAAGDAAAPCDGAWDDLPPPAMPLDGDADALGCGFDLDGLIEGDVEPASAARDRAAAVAEAAVGDEDGLSDFALDSDLCIDVRWPWTRIQEVLGASGACCGVGRPLVVSQGGHTPFGSTFFHALPGLAFEVMQNGFVASLTVFSVPPGKLPPIFQIP